MTLTMGWWLIVPSLMLDPVAVSEELKQTHRLVLYRTDYDSALLIRYFNFSTNIAAIIITNKKEQTYRVSHRMRISIVIAKLEKWTNSPQAYFWKYMSTSKLSVCIPPCQSLWRPPKILKLSLRCCAPERCEIIGCSNCEEVQFLQCTYGYAVNRASKR